MQNTTDFQKDNYYNVTQLCSVLKASFTAVNAAIEAGNIPYEESPLTGRKYFPKDQIHKQFNIYENQNN